MMQIRPVPILTPAEIKRFESKVDKTGACWSWSGARTPFGYGRFSVRKTTHYAHRVAWLIFHGNTPEKLVLHACDNPWCVRPDHLFQGTHAENSLDMTKKGRQAIGDHVPKSSRISGDRHWTRKNPELACRGTRHWSAKFNVDDVLRIREMFRRGMSNREIAREFSASPDTVYNITSGRKWRILV